MPATTSKGRKVKSALIRAGEPATPRTARLPAPAEVASLMDAAEAGVMACVTICFCSWPIATLRSARPLACGTTSWTSMDVCGCVVSKADFRRTADRSRRVAGRQAAPCDACRRAALAVRFRARSAVDPPGSKLPVGSSREARRSCKRPPPHAAPFLRLRPCGQRTRFASDPGLSRPPRSPTSVHYTRTAGRRFEGLWR